MSHLMERFCLTQRIWIQCFNSRCTNLRSQGRLTERKINFRLPFFDARKATFPLLKFPITFQTYNEIVFEFIPALSICQRCVKFSWSEVEKNTRWTLHMRKEHYIYVSLMQRPSCTLFILLLKPKLKVFCCKSKYQASIIHYLIYVFSSYFFLSVFLS